LLDAEDRDEERDRRTRQPPPESIAATERPQVGGLAFGVVLRLRRDEERGIQIQGGQCSDAREAGAPEIQRAQDVRHEDADQAAEYLDVPKPEPLRLILQHRRHHGAPFTGHEAQDDGLEDRIPLQDPSQCKEE